jgi:hypothetical protein
MANLGVAIADKRRIDGQHAPMGEGPPVTVDSDDPTMLDGQAIEQIRGDAFRHGFDAAAVAP